MPEDETTKNVPEDDITQIRMDHGLEEVKTANDLALIRHSPTTEKAGDSEDDVALSNSSSLISIILKLSTKVTLEEFVVPVRRGHVLEDAIRSVKRKSFSPILTLKVGNV